MKPGSVIVDMAAANGGNVEGSVAGREGRHRRTASRSSATPTWPAGCRRRPRQLYGTNLVNLMKLLTPEKDGQLVLDFDDVVQRGDHRGARRRDDLAAAAGAGLGGPGRRSPRRRAAAKVGEAAGVRGHAGSASSGSAALALFLITAFSPPALIGHLMVFALAIVIGYYVIGNVHHALHTPLMSVTNAISGIIVVGALLQIGQHGARGHDRGVRRDPAGHHQRLRRVRRDPPHARHVPSELS